MKNIYLYFVICCGTVYSSFAQTGTIQGKVTDNGGNPIEFANIVVEGTTLGATSGTDGSYQVVNVPVGPVDLVVSSVQYETMTRKVRVSAGQTLNQDFTMTLRLTELGSVTVSGSTV
ncbi:MAG: carboxypeptidase-like regulatory domain-containing protein, partial [Bacteroidota bacterium]